MFCEGSESVDVWQTGCTVILYTPSPLATILHIKPATPKKGEVQIRRNLQYTSLWYALVYIREDWILRGPRSSSFWLPRNLSNHMDRQARTGDTVRLQIGVRSQTLPWWLGGRRGKDDRKQNTLPPVGLHKPTTPGNWQLKEDLSNRFLLFSLTKNRLPPIRDWFP